MIDFFKLVFLTSFLVLTLNANDNNQTRITDRELSADEDPLTKQQSIKLKQEDKSPFNYLLYGSLREHYRHISGGESAWEDSGSRLGINSWYEIQARTWVFARYELGFNILKELGLDTPSYPADERTGDTLYTRLAYIGFQKNKNIIAFGKNWSTYYQVASFTDRFDSLGGEASGAYNAHSDGGASGTGRADQVLQTRLNFDLFSSTKPLEVNFQLQPGQEIVNVNAEYEYGLGISALWGTLDNIKIGIAYNYAPIDLDKISPSQRNGLDGDLQALLVGAQFFSENWYLGVNFSVSNNLQSTDMQQYFKGKGMELYTQYRVFKKVWLLGGYNYLKPDSNQAQTGEYLLSYGIVGLRYSIDEFYKMFYLEGSFNNGRESDNSRQGNQVIIGIRWGFESN